MIKKAKKNIPGELIYGIHPLIEVLRAKRRKVISIYTTKPTPKQWHQIEAFLPKYHVPIQYVSRDILTKMAGTTDHQAVVAWVQNFPFRKKSFDPKLQRFILVLDSIQDPRNLGAILRSAYCTGVEGVVLTTRNSASLSSVAVKSAAGLCEHLEIQIVPTINEAIQEYKGVYNLYLAAFGGQDATKQDYSLPTCLVIGNEAIGISKPILKMGTIITLPQKETEISYNASVAAGILLFMISTRNKLI